MYLTIYYCFLKFIVALLANVLNLRFEPSLGYDTLIKNSYYECILTISSDEINSIFYYQESLHPITDLISCDIY